MSLSRDLLSLLGRAKLSECGDSSPPLLAATRRGESPPADESAVEKVGASSRTPNCRENFGLGRPAQAILRTPLGPIDMSRRLL